MKTALQIAAVVFTAALVSVPVPATAWQVHKQVSPKTDEVSSGAYVLLGEGRVFLISTCLGDIDTGIRVGIQTTADFDFLHLGGDITTMESMTLRVSEVWYRVDGAKAKTIPAWQVFEIFPTQVYFGNVADTLSPGKRSSVNQFLQSVRKGNKMRIGVPIQREPDWVFDINLAGASAAIDRANAYCQ